MLTLFMYLHKLCINSKDVSNFFNYIRYII